MVSLPVRRAGVAFLFAIAPLVATAQQPAPALRVWTAVSGQKFQAKLIGLEGTNAIFQLTNGQTAKVAMQSLSADDLAAARGGAAPNPAPAAGGAVKPVAKPRTWPSVVEVGPDSVEITMGEQDAAKRRYVYKSRSFEFVSQDKLAIPPHSPTPVPILTVSGAADAKANS